MLLEEAWNSRTPSKNTPLTPKTANQSSFQPASRPIRLQVLPRGNTPRQLFPDLTETDVVSFYFFFPRTVSARSWKSSVLTWHRNMSLPEYPSAYCLLIGGGGGGMQCLLQWPDLMAAACVVSTQTGWKTCKTVWWHCDILINQRDPTREETAEKGFL